MKIRFIAPASEDITEIVEHYLSESPKAAAEFLDDWNRCLELLRLFPRAGAAISPNCRSTIMRRFPYRVIYHLPAPDVIEIVALHHHARGPQTWSDRVEEEATTYGSHPDAPDLAESLQRVLTALPEEAPDSVRRQLLELTNTL